MAFNRSGRSRVIRVTPSCGLVDDQCTCVHRRGHLRLSAPGDPKVGHIATCRRGREPWRRGLGSRTWDCSIRASSTRRGRGLRLARTARGAVRLLPPWQPITVGPGGGLAGRRAAVLRLPGRVSLGGPAFATYDPPHRFVDELVSLPLPGATRTRSRPWPTSRTRVTDVRRDAGPGLVPRADVPLPASASWPADLAAHQRHDGPADGRPLTVAVTGLVGPDRLGPVRLPCAPAGTASSAWSGGRPASAGRAGVATRTTRPGCARGCRRASSTSRGASIAGRFTDAPQALRPARAGSGRPDALARPMADLRERAAACW